MQINTSESEYIAASEVLSVEFLGEFDDDILCLRLLERPDQQEGRKGRGSKHRCRERFDFRCCERLAQLQVANGSSGACGRFPSVVKTALMQGQIGTGFLAGDAVGDAFASGVRTVRASQRRIGANVRDWGTE